MPLGGLVVGGLGQIGSSIIGGIAAGNQRAQAQAAIDAALAQIQAVGAPPDQAQAIMLQQFKSAGILTPQLEQNINDSFNAAASVQQDPKLAAAQNAALQGLAQTGQGNLNPTSMAALNKIQQQTGQDTQSTLAAIAQQNQARGMAGSGSQLAQQLMAAQGASANESNAGINLAGQTQSNALNALAQSGALGGQMQSALTNLNLSKAQAANQIAQFNTANQIGVQAQNTQAQNQAQAANLSNAQNISNSNTQLANAETQRELQAQETYYNQQMGAAQAANAVRLGQVAQSNTNATNTAQQFGNIGSAIGGLGNAYSQKQNSNNLLNTLYPNGNPSSTITTPNLTVPSTNSIPGLGVDTSVNSGLNNYSWLNGNS